MLGSLHVAPIAAFFCAMGGVVAGCASDDGPYGGERIERARSAIIGGEPSEASQDSVVMLVFSDAAGSRRGICTAALVAPRLVLTARHCVSETDEDVSCSVDGTAVHGGAVRATHDARDLYVFTGTGRPDLEPATWRPAGRGIEVLDDGSDNLCNHDLALVLLENPISGVPIASIRLDDDATKDEPLTTVGWGVTSSVDEPGTRQQRSGVAVTRVGPDAHDPVLTPNELGFDESICLGDSGGPILSTETNAIVGVVSRGGNGTSSRTDLASTCTKATNLGTKVAPFRALVMRAFARAGAQPVLEQRTSEDDGGGCSVTLARAGSRASGGGARDVLTTALAVLGVVLARRRRARVSAR